MFHIDLDIPHFACIQQATPYPLGSRIIAVADAYCALRTDRAHRKAFSKEKALEIIEEESGKKWDHMLVDIMKHVSY